MSHNTQIDKHGQPIPDVTPTKGKDLPLQQKNFQFSPGSSSPFEIYCGQNSCISYNDNHDQVLQARNILTQEEKYHEIECNPRDYILSDTSPSHDQKQVMTESTNNFNTRASMEGPKAESTKENVVAMSLKFENLYKSTPLNVIQEKWELESRASVLQDTKNTNNMSRALNQTHQSENSYSSKIQQKSRVEKQNQSKMSIPSRRVTEMDQSSNKSRLQEKKEKVEAIKNRIKQLFLNYCDFSVDNGNIFITNSSFFKLLKDAKILDTNTVNINSVSILLTKECNTNCNLIKNITFDQFLNVILMISELKYSNIYAKHPKKALQKLLVDHVLPLLEHIEMSVLKHREEQIHSLYSVSELTLKLIIFNKDTQVLFQDALPIFRKIYESYFEQEIACQKGKCQDLMKVSLKSVMNFTRDFELCPYLIHQKACFLIWYSVAYSTSIQDMCNNQNQKQVLPNSLNCGKSFTLGHFLIFFYRLSIVYFNHQNDKAQEYNLIKKLIYFLRKLENSDGFKKFMTKLNRTYNENFTFLPSKDLLLQILKAEGLDQKFITTTEDIEFISKEAMISRIVDPQQTQNTLEDDELIDNVEIQEECDTYLQNCEDELRKLFQIYCSYGDPMNTKYLKSSKMVKLMKDCGLLKGQSQIPNRKQKRVKQITLVELDLAFKKVCAPKQVNSPMQDNLTSMMSFGASIDQSHQMSMNWLQQSQMTSRLNFKFPGNQSTMHQNSFNKTFNFENHSHLTDKHIQNIKLDFNQFKLLLEQLSLKMIPDFPPSLAYVEVIKSYLLPHLSTLSDKRCIHNSKIQKILSNLDNEEIIHILTVLHKAIIDIYKIYADKKKHMNFQQFMTFCTDYDIFPYLVSKPALYRIFHSLSFINEFIGGEKSFNRTFSPLKSPQTSKLSMMKSGIVDTPKQQSEMIDEHLFVEALALCALYKGDEVDEKDNGEGFENCGDVNEQTNVELILEFVEKIANSEGIHKRMRSQKDKGNQLKCNLLEKKDILEPFRQKYSWYFRQKYYTSEKKKNFEDVMEMSSVWTNSSQIL